jgi:primosomal protein N' (replication factor Y)
MMLPHYLKKPHKSDFSNIMREDALSHRHKKNGFFNAVFVKANNFLDRYHRWKEILEKKLEKGSALICYPQTSYLKEAKAVLEKDFPGKIKVIHSYEKEKEIFFNWKDTRQKSLILGTRMAIFYYPLDLNLIIIEEENSPYYFQEEKPYYHILDIALLLSKIKKIDLILSADLPSLSAYKLIKEKMVSLEEIGADNKKEIKAVEVGEYKRTPLSPVLTELLRRNIRADRKAIVLWNKKGLGSYLICSSCGYTLKCERCSGFIKISLNEKTGICPYCGKKQDLPKTCTHCNSGYIRTGGLGIEKIELILRRTFPEAKIKKWEERTPDTQIILSTSKILSFLYKDEKFDIGFLLDVDSFLSRFDYEATFDTFLYLKKLSLFLRECLYAFTVNKNHYFFETINEKELAFRKNLGLPPFGLLTKVTLRAKKEDRLFKRSNDLYNRLKEKGLEVYGPFKEQPFKLRDKFRYSLIVKSKRSYLLRKIMKEEVKNFRSSSLKLAIIIK